MVNQLEQDRRNTRTTPILHRPNLIAGRRNFGQVALQASSTAVDGAEQLIEGRRSIEKAEEEYEQTRRIQQQQPKAEKKIAEAKTRIELAQEQADNLYRSRILGQRQAWLTS